MAQPCGELLLLPREKSRVHELNRYFAAVRDLPHSHAGDDDNVTPGPQLCADPALTAFAQLSALRVDCERAFISLIDSDEQHIVAEATRSISLTDSSVHAEGDGLSFGAMTLDLLAGVCGGTMQVLTAPDSRNDIRTDNIYADRSRYVINDFTCEAVYEERPYVQGFPYMRFYACVPLIADSGHVIGSIAVVDSKSRAGLSAEHHRILTEIASTAMSHLALQKISQEHDRAGRLLEGLKHYVQRDIPTRGTGDGRVLSGVSDVLPSQRPIATIDAELGANGKDSQKRRGSPDLSSDSAESPSREDTDTASGNEGTSASLLSATLPTIDNHRITSLKEKVRVEDPPVPASDVLRNKFDAMTPEPNPDGISRTVHRSFKDAAKVLSQAMDLEGVVFLDATPAHTSLASDKAGNSNLLEQPPQFHLPNRSNYDKQSSIDPAVEPGLTRSMDNMQIQQRRMMCKKLGESVREYPKNVTSLPTQEPFSLPEDMHQLLQNQYPRGAILILDREGASNNISQSFANVEEALCSFFPDATSILYMPIWDSNTTKSAIGSFGWTSNSRRSFSTEDLAYFTAFGSLVMTEVRRLELAATDQMKSDFISSISHELRSPLHGILGGAQLLLDEPLLNNQKETLGMIVTCGKALLDTMEHILVHSKINAVTKDRQKHLEAKLKTHGQEYSDAAYESHSTFDLASLVEDTVESTVAGRDFSNPWLSEDAASGSPSRDSDPTSPVIANQNSPSVLLAIEGRCAWVVKSEAGAWRRILMNLLGNALKYTAAGFIEVGLHLSDPQPMIESAEFQRTVNLSVKDSGRGISKRYLQNNLYSPFSQENVLSSGAGLGLSIVRQLVKSLNGKIDVQSEVGWGTCFVLSVPVTFYAHSPEPTTLVKLKPLAMGRKLCLLALDLYPELGDAPTGILSTSARAALAQKTAIINQAEQWFGMSVVSAQKITGIDADVIMVEEENLPLLWPHGTARERATSSLGATPLIILRGGTKSEPYFANTPSGIHYLTRPIGPRKLASVLSACFEAQKLDAPPKSLPITATNSELSPSSTRLNKDLDSAGSINGTDKEPSPNTAKTGEVDQPAKKVHLLLVDDNIINLKILVAWIKKLSCTYKTATNGLEALKIYESSPQHFDFVFMDISMPIMDGYTSTRAIRAVEAKANLRPSTVIALSGLGSIEAQREGQLSGMDLFLTKPLPMQRIKKIVEGTDLGEAAPL